jgi:hypothetical protein
MDCCNLHIQFQFHLRILGSGIGGLAILCRQSKAEKKHGLHISPGGNAHQGCSNEYSNSQKKYHQDSAGNGWTFHKYLSADYTQLTHINLSQSFQGLISLIDAR